MNDKHLKKMALALRRLDKIERSSSIDPANLEARPSPKQQEILESFGDHKITIVRGGNQSSKSTLGARTFSWMLTETHPYWQRPAAWKNERLQILVLGKSGKIIEESLYYRMKSYIDPSELHEFRAGNILQKVVHKPTGNTVLFQSYENVNQARERIQSYTAHAVWIDEMPNSLELFSESLRRIQARDGYFWATFTPLIVNNDIRNFCDNLPPSQGQMFKIHMFDNPLYTPEKQAKILEEMALYPEHVRKCRLEGEWMSAENAVYYFSPEVMVRDLPSHYSPGWRHVESSDPAARSAHGLTIWAEDPTTGLWYCVRAEYLQGLRDTDEYILAVKQRTAGLNIVRRLYDSACPWYADLAVKHGLNYTPVMNKAHRKLEMIKALQLALGQQLFLTPWCQDLADELNNMQWSESAENKVANSSKYHLHDSAVYFLDCKPKYEGAPVASDYWQSLRQANQKRKVAEYEAKKTSPLARSRQGIKHRGRVWGKPWR
jgi:phage terminase large subunit-like protein/DNA-binding transcriptional regulator YhcF (GntR family)